MKMEVKLACGLALVLAVFTCLANASTKNVCPYVDNLVSSEHLRFFQDKCYSFHVWATDYRRANNHCINLGGFLVTVKDSAVNDFLVDVMERIYEVDTAPHGTWIGLNDMIDEGEFVWSDGTPMNYSNFKLGQGNNRGFFSNLAPSKRVEDCVAIKATDGKWYDYKCEKSYGIFNVEKPYICEHRL